MPDYQKQGQPGQDGLENGNDGAVALYKPPNMMAGAVPNNTGTYVLTFLAESSGSHGRGWWGGPGVPCFIAGVLAKCVRHFLLSFFFSRSIGSRRWG